MSKLATIAKTAETPDRVIDSYMLRQTSTLRPGSLPVRGEATLDQVISMFADYGRAMTPALMAQVAEMDDKARGRFFAFSGEALHAAFGTHFRTSPMYRAFPNHQDVMIDKSLVDFLLLTGMTELPTTSAETHGANPVTGEQTDELGPDARADDKFSRPLMWRDGRKVFQFIDAGSDEGISLVAQRLLGSLTPFTPDDAEFVAACVDEGHVGAEDLSRVKFREKLPALAGLVSADVYQDAAVSVTDALRLAAHFSNGDVSLTLPVKFRLQKAAGKRVLRLAEHVIMGGRGTPDDDVIRHEESWKRLIRHVGTERAAKVAPLLSVLVSEVRSGAVRSWNSRVAHARPAEAASMMASRPGAFVRGALALSRRFDAENADRADLIKSAEQAFAKAPVPALLQLRTVLSRTVRKTDRYHVMKNGQVLRSERAPEVHDDLLRALEDALHGRLAGLLPWSAAENAENRFVPVGGRTASASSDGSMRGDSVRLRDPDPKRVRLFLHWKDSSDVDLSAVMLNAAGETVADCSYYNLNCYGTRNIPFATHSGDIRDGRRGAAEYVDIDVDMARKAGIKTVLLVVNVFSGKPFAEFPTHVGAMSRDGVTGRHFELETVEAAMRVTSASTMCTCAAFDLDTLRMTYVDMPAAWGQRMNVSRGQKTINSQVSFVMGYGDYRVSMADVLEFAGTPGGPVLTDRELVEKRSEILASLADVPEGAAPRAEDDGLSMC